MAAHSLDQWLSHLDGLSQTASGWTALCPAHDDREASLSLALSHDGVSGVVYCFAGCTYPEIEKAVFNGELSSKPIKIIPLHSVPGDDSVGEGSDLETLVGETRAWWQWYTKVPIEAWESWGVSFGPGTIEFGWPNVSSIKGRPAKSHTFFWEPESGPRPSLWPAPKRDLPSIVWITEGETDAGVLRHLGLEAFAVTKGAAGIPSLEKLWRQLKQRGAEKIVVLGDLDPAGQRFEESVRQQILKSSLRVGRIDLSEIADLFLGEKDLRDVWKSGRFSIEDLREFLETRYSLDIVSDGLEFQLEVGDFLAQPAETVPWLCQPVIPLSAIGMLVGEPKKGKSWLALDLCLSIASGRDFLGAFPVETSGPTVYITKEDTAISLKSRVAKILISKGLGGSVSEDLENDTIKVTFPQKLNHEFWISRRPDFYLTTESIKDLIEWLSPIKPKLIVFDPIMRMIWQADEFKASEVAKGVFDPLGILSRDLGCAVLFIHHKSKAGGTYGSIAFHAFVDSAVYLEETGASLAEWTTVRSEFKSAESETWSYRLRDLKDGYSPSVLKGDEISESIQDQIIEEARASAGPIKISDLRSNLKISSDTLRRYIDDLKEQGIIDEIGNTISIR